MTLLTDTSLRHCKNNRRALLEEIDRKWRCGELVSEWNGKFIDPNDEEAYDEYVRAEIARLTAPILMAHMVRFVQKYEKRKIAVVFHISGYPDAVRFFKNRLHHVNQVPEYILRHPRYSDLFKGNIIYTIPYQNKLLYYSRTKKTKI